MAIDKIFNDANVDGIADNIFGAVNNSVSEVKAMQQRKAAENVQMVVEAFKKIETNITEKFDNVTDVIEKRVLTIKDGRDGSSGSDGRNGRDGKPGRDGVNGKQGTPGTPGKDGVDGEDGVSVTNANIDFDGSLVISLSTGQQINVGEIVPPELEKQIKVISTMSTNGAVGIKDEGSSISTGVKNINFVGATVTATASGDDVTVNVSAGTGTVTSVAATVPAFLSVAGSPVTTTGTLAISLSGTALPVANGGTGLASGTSGGVLAYTAAGTLASSAALAASALVIGGGAGAAPSTTTTGTGVVTALGVNTGTAGAFVVNGGALGTPSSGTLTSATGLPISTGVSGLGTGIATALAVNVGTAGAPVVNGGALGTPSSGTVTNLTGTASININGTVGATTPGTGAFTSLTASTTLGVTGVSTLTGGAVIQTLTVGFGAGAVSSNTAVGVSALAANQAGGTFNTAIGNATLDANTTGGENTAVGSGALGTNTTGNYNSAFGVDTLSVNLTGSSNNAFGGSDTLVGSALSGNTTGGTNNAFGNGALSSNTTASSNSAFGHQALNKNTTADRNTAVGYQAGYTNTTNIASTFVGYRAGYLSTGAQCTFVGDNAGQNSTGTLNGFFGQAAGYLVTSGAKNTIIGSYSGNQGGLDIRTASNYIVLSDGDGNPRGIFDGSGNLLVGTTSAFSGSGINPKVTVSNSAGIGLINIGSSDAGMVTKPAANTNYYAGFFLNSSSSGVGDIFCTGSSTSYNSPSDYRLKTAISSVTGHGERIDSLKPIDYQWKTDNSQARGFLAHEFKTVYPNSVSGDKDAVDADGKPMYQSMQASTSEVIADLVAELQSLRARVAQLESKP